MILVRFLIIRTLLFCFANSQCFAQPKPALPVLNSYTYGPQDGITDTYLHFLKVAPDGSIFCGSITKFALFQIGNNYVRSWNIQKGIIIDIVFKPNEGLPVKV